MWILAVLSAYGMYFVVCGTLHVSTFYLEYEFSYPVFLSYLCFSRHGIFNSIDRFYCKQTTANRKMIRGEKKFSIFRTDLITLVNITQKEKNFLELINFIKKLIFPFRVLFSSRKSCSHALYRVIFHYRPTRRSSSNKTVSITPSGKKKLDEKKGKILVF